jgi:hypothetical protein
MASLPALVGAYHRCCFVEPRRQIPLEDLDAIFETTNPKQEAFKVIRARKLKDREAREDRA